MFPNNFDNDFNRRHPIIMGGAAVLVVRLIDTETNDPYDLTGVTALTTCFENEDGTELALSLGGGVTIVSAPIGKIQINLTSAQTALLAAVNNATLELSITTSGDPIKCQIFNAYSVIASIC